MLSSSTDFLSPIDLTYSAHVVWTIHRTIQAKIHSEIATVLCIIQTNLDQRAQKMRNKIYIFFFWTQSFSQFHNPHQGLRNKFKSRGQSVMRFFKLCQSVADFSKFMGAIGSFNLTPCSPLTEVLPIHFGWTIIPCYF